MALTPRLDVRQSQSLTLTPQLMQSIKLLQLGHLELNAFVEAELERNPLLERDIETNGEADGERDSDAEAPAPSDNGDPLDSYEQGETIGTADSMAAAMDTDVDNLFPEQVGQDSLHQSRGPDSGGGSLQSADAPNPEAYIAADISLAEHLWSQIVTLVGAPGDRLIARNLIDNLDEGGYLGADLETVAAQLGTDLPHVEKVLSIVQGCEPAGVFARSVAECLALQLKERDRFDPLMQRLVAHLDLVAGHDIVGLMRAVGADREDIIDMLGELRTLDPKPGRAFDASVVRAVVPDIFVREGPSGSWLVELNTEVLPRVLVNRTYYANVSRRTRDAGEKAFLIDCLQSANWLTKSLDQRAQTILKVATEIVKQQDAFLVHGVSHLRPMTLKMVAEAIDMHESTVSRVTANKYMATPRGLLEMKYFFTTALGSTAGGEAEHSAEAVRHRIRQLVAGESAKAILSDDTIADILKRDDGIDIARRTVAKYRESMDIPSSVIRRRQKRAGIQMA